MGVCRSLIFALTATVMLKALSVLPALVLANIVDNADKLAPPTTTIIWLFLVLITIQAVFTPIQSWCLASLAQNQVRKLSACWCATLLGKRFEAYGQLQGGVLVKVLDRGITAQERWLGFLIGSAWPVLAEALILVGLFIYMGAGLVLLGLIPLSFGYLWANNRLVRWRRPHIDAVNNQEDKLAEQWVNVFACSTAIKLECAEAMIMKPVDKTLADYAAAAVCVATSAGWLQAAKILFIGLASGGLLAWGIHDQAQAVPSLSLGELVALLTLITGLLAGVAQLAEAWRMLDQFRADHHKLKQWLGLPPFGPSCKPMRDPGGSHEYDSGLHLEPCSLLENGEQRLLLEQALTIHPGERVALCGPSGSGKSTLLHALAGILEPLRKSLRLDGIAVDNIEPVTQLARLRLCPQEDSFMPGMLGESVLFGQPHDRQRVEQLLGRLGFNSGWYERDIDGRGESISGGEARRLCLLRLLDRPGDFNLFDEPTSGLDAALAERTWDLLFETFKNCALICVTHDEAALSRFDRVIRMKDGRVTAVETP